MDIEYSAIDDKRTEKLLSEKLLNGFVLLKDGFCPACSTPLVKNPTDDKKRKKGTGLADHYLIPGSSFEQPFRPVAGVPVCITCNSHVVTNEGDIDLLQKCESLKDKGTILVAMRESEEEKKESEDHEYSRRATVHEIINLTDHVFVEEKPQEKARRPSPETLPCHSLKGTTAGTVTTKEEYSVRREVATKVLGAKMLQGYTLQETTCDRCGMPQMEKRGNIECVVCPALAKKAKKKMKAEKKLAETKTRLEREIALKKMDAAAAKADKEHLMALEQEEEARIAALEEEEAQLLREARERARTLARQQEQDQFETFSKQRAEEERLIALKRQTEDKLAAERFRQREEERALLEETKRLEEIEIMTFSTKTSEMHLDLMRHEHRRRVAKKLVLDSEVAKLEEERLQEQLELRRIADEKKAEEEARFLQALEAEAAAKALAAEDAIRKAKAALETVHSTKREMIAETIKLAEREAIAECEETIKAEREDYKEKVILPSESELHNERWETLRVEGRAILTRRVLKGWELIPESCQGAECQMTPLLMKNGKKECVVCGGCGNGKDGAYACLDDDEEVGLRPLYEGHYAALNQVPSEIQAEMPGQLFDAGDFDAKRDIVSKEIGKRMTSGWTLLDASCPKCVMPLMMDNLGKPNICVLHGPVELEYGYDQKPSGDFDEPTVDETEYQTEPESQHDAEDLIRAIRRRASQQNSVRSASSSRSDPPAFTNVDKTRDRRHIIPQNKKSLDFADPIAVKELLDSGTECEEDQDANSITPVMVAKMLMKSPQGHNLMDLHMTFEEAKDLVDIFAAANFEKPLSPQFKDNVARIIVSRLNDDDVIHLEHLGNPVRSSPRNFNFDEYGDGMPQQQTTSPTNKGTRPPRSPPNKNKHVVVGGPLGKAGARPSNYYFSQHRHSDTGSIGGASRASTCASDALESIYIRIDECKAKLMDPTNSITDQLATADLLEKLAKAAVAVRNMERLEEEA
jgi:uncharacterized Zn finger protein (UPF0148 family)